MKKISILAVVAMFFSSCGSWVRIGDLTSISNRNLDDSKNYTLISRDVEAISEKGSDAMEQAVDDLTKKYQGEFVRNAKIYVKSNGKKVKVVGDVWGIQNTNVNITTVAQADISINVGDAVVFKRKNKIIHGKIIGINQNNCIVEYGNNKRIELKFDEVTKTNKP